MDVYSPLGLPLQWLAHVSGSGRKQQTTTLRPSKQEEYYIPFVMYLATRSASMKRLLGLRTLTSSYH